MISDNLQTRQYFDRLAETWTERTNPDIQKLAAILEAIDIAPTDHLLDLGCGTGVLFTLLKQYVYEWKNIFAIDFAQEMILNARENFGDVRLSCAAVEQLPFQANFFDKVIAFQLMPHLHDKFGAIAECRRILKPSGDLCIFHLQCSRKLNAFHATLSEPVRQHRLPPVDDLCELIENAGMKIIQKTEHPELYFVKVRKVN